MLDKVKLELAAKNWIDAWNKRDFEGLMSHYAEGVEFTKNLNNEDPFAFITAYFSPICM